MSINPSTYADWLDFVFNRPPTENGWYHDEDDTTFDAPSTTQLHLIRQTCLSACHDLTPYNDRQIAEGMEFIFNSACADTVHLFKNRELPASLRQSTLASLPGLYQLIAQRCPRNWQLHLNAANNPLAAICFMLWDASNLTYWEADPEAGNFMTTCVSVLNEILSIGHPVCTESALHGFGHLHVFAPASLKQRIETHINDWLNTQPNLPTSVLNYAISARCGGVA